MKSFFKKEDNLIFLKELENNSEIKGNVKTIYIDPPFTTNRVFETKQGDYAYQDKLSDEDFLLFLKERILIAKNLLREDGFFFLHIDNKIGHYVKILLDEIFGKENFVTNIIVKIHIKWGKFIYIHEKKFKIKIFLD